MRGGSIWALMVVLLVVAPRQAVAERREAQLVLGGGVDLATMVGGGNGSDFPPSATAVGVGAHVGVMVTRRLALLGEVHVNASSELRQATALGALQFWVTRGGWLKAGVGAGQLHGGGASDSQNVGYGTTLMGAIGYDVMMGRTIAIDLHARFSQGSFGPFDQTMTVLSIGVGLSWNRP